jgi:hypothetical protein
MRFLRKINEGKSPLTSFDKSSLKIAFLKKGIDIDSNDIKQPVIPNYVLHKLNILDCRLYSYKEDRRNVYIILDLRSDEIVAIQKSGDYKKFVENFYLSKIADRVIEGILDTYVIRKYEKDNLNISGDFYLINKTSMEDISWGLFYDNYNNSSLKIGDSIFFKIQNSIIFIYINEINYSDTDVELKLVGRKKLSQEEEKKILNHLDNLHLSEYDPNLFNL